MKRDEIIQFIMVHNSSFNVQNIDEYSNTELVILKVSIELELARQKKVAEGNLKKKESNTTPVFRINHNSFISNNVLKGTLKHSYHNKLS